MNIHTLGSGRFRVNRRLTMAVAVLFIASLGIFGVPEVHAEVYALALSSSRVQEYNTPGVTLYMNVTGATIGARYQITFRVTEPNGQGHSSSNSTTASSATLVLSAVYPRDFGPGVLMPYVGNYTINVQQNQPVNKPSVATGQFQVGLTDSPTYLRTNWMSILANGYAANENITTSLKQGVSQAPGFPSTLLADTSGNLNFSWRIPPSEALGPYTLTLTGSRTTKAPSDTQTLTIDLTTVSIAGLTVKSPSISRTLTQQFLFVAQYPDGQRVQTGQATVRIAESDGVTRVNVTASYDSSTGTFHAAYYLPASATTGIWIATIDTNRFDDGYGNIGPAFAVPAGFNVLPALLNVSITTGPTGKTYSAGDIIPVYASVSYPDGTAFSSGTVTASFSRGGVLVGTPATLTYVPGQNLWAGNYQVNQNDPSGIWIVTVDASDILGDAGQGTSSAAVSTPPAAPSTTTWLTTSTFLLLAAIAAAAAIGVLVWALFMGRKKVRKTEMKLDLRMVDREVDRIQGSAFFQNVKKQVEENTSEAQPPNEKVEDKNARTRDEKTQP